MTPFLVSLLLLCLLLFDNQAAAQYDFDQVIADVKRISTLSSADQAEVNRLNEQLKTIYENAYPDEIDALTVLQAETLSLPQLINRSADQIDEQMRKGNFARVGIPELTTGADRTFDPKYGALPRYITDSLRAALAAKAKQNKGDYSVFSEEALRKTLQEQGVTPGDLGTEKTKNLQINGDEISLLVDGHLTILESGGIIFDAKLINPKKQNVVSQIRHAAMLEGKELEMSGISVKLGHPSVGKSTQYRLEPGVGLVTEKQLNSVRRVRGAFVEPHPFAPEAILNRTDDTIEGTFDVRIETRSNSRRAYSELSSNRIAYQGNVCYIGMNKGDEYRIRYKVTYPEIVFVRVMVDGLNSLSQRPTAYSRISRGTRGAFVEAAEPASENGEEEFILAPRVPLEEARAWVVDVPNDRRVHLVEGFVDADGRTETLRRFKIVDLDESVAARKHYTEQIGLITVAFYKAVANTDDEARLAKPRLRSIGVGTGMGRTEGTNLTYFTGDEVPGGLIAIYNFRYMPLDMLRQLQRTK